MAQDTPQDPQQDRPVSLDEFEEQRRQYYGIPKGLSVALRTQESGGKQYDKSGNVLTSPKNAKGRYQVLPGTAAQYGLNADDPFENTEAAFRYMADLHKKVDPNVKDPGERWASVVAGYHSGEGGLNRVNKTGNMPSTNDGLIKTDDYVANVMKRWQQHDAGDTSAPTAQPAPQSEAAPLRPVRRDQVPGPQKTTARGPVLPKEGNPFAINQGATGFQQQAQQANARTGQISPEVVAQADAKARFNEQPLYKRVGQFAANQFAQGGQQAQQTLQNAVGALARGSARMMNPVGASVPPVDIRSAQGKAAQEATAQRLTREEQAFPQDMATQIAGGTLKALPTMAAITAAGELAGPAAGLAAAGGSTAANADWANHPVKSALETAGSVALPYIGGKAGSKAAGLIAGRLSPGVAGALTGAFHTAGAGAANAVAPIAENVYEGKPIDWQRAATEAGIGVATGLPFAGAAAREGRANANRTAMNRAVQAGELAPVQGEGGTQIQRIPGANTPAYQGLVQEGQARGRAGVGAPKQAAPAEPQAAPGQPETPAQATPSALPQDRLAGIRVLGEAERVPMRDRARAKSIVYSDENGVPQNVRVLLPEGMSLGDAKRVLRDARKYQAQQNAEATPAQPEATPAPPENPRSRAISRGREIEQQARAEADTAIQEGRHDDARAALKRRIAALQDTRANIKRDTPGAVSLRAQLGEQIFRTQEELRGLKTPAQRPARPAPEVRPPGNEPTRDLTTPFPQAARVEPTTPLAQAEAPARKTADLPAREQVQPQAQETAQAPVVPATPTPAAQRPATSANARRRYGRGMDEAVTVHFENQADALRFDASKRGRHAAIGPEADQVAREFGIDRREAAGAIYDWRRTVEAAAKSAKPGTDVAGPSFAEFVRARQQAAAQAPEARAPQPPTGPLTEPTNRLQEAEYAGGELPRTAGLRPEGQPVETPSRAVDPIDTAPEAKPYEVSDQMARRRQEREAALKGPFGKFAEQARKFAGKEHALASHPEMRRLLDLPEMPDYKRDQKGWTEATHDTMNALAELADQPRSSHIDEDMIKGAWDRLERRAEERKAPISDDLRETMADTWERHLTAQDNYQNFIVDGRIDNILRRLDQQHEQPISRREAAELKAALVSTAGEYGLSNNYAENLWKTAQADAASRAKRGGSRAAQEAVYGGSESARAADVRVEGQERATGTYGRERDTGRGVSAEAPAPKPPKMTPEQYAAWERELGVPEKQIQESLKRRQEGFSLGKLPNETEGGTTLGSGFGALQGMGKLFRRDTAPPKGAEIDAWADQVSRRIHDSMDDATVGTLDDVVNRAMSAASAGDKAAWNKYRRQAEAILQAQPERDIKKRDYFTSPLSNLNHKGTYERLAGETGKEVSELIRNAQIELDKGGDRAEVFKRLRRDSRVYEAALRDNNLPGLAQYLRRHVDYITQGSTPWSETANTLRGLQYNLKLRINPRSTAVNLLQPFQTLWPHMSTAEYASVTRDAMRSETKARLDKIFGDDSALAMEGADPKRKWDMFGAASAFNRRVGYLAGERMADRLWLTGEAKDRHARDWAKKVEFDSGRYDAPPIFRGDAASLLLQFKGFQVKNWERIIADVKNEAPGSITGRKARIGKMLLSQVAIGGVRSLKVPNMLAGFLIVGGISKALQKTGMSPDAADKAAETVYYGLPALVGQDFSGSVGLFDEPFGKTAEERVVNFLGGPTISTGVNLAKGAKDFYDAKDTRETTATEKRKRIALKAAKGITPYAKTAHALANLGMGMAGKQPTKTPDLPIGGQGSPMTPTEAIGYGFMGTPVRQTKYYDKEEAWDWEKNLLGEPTGKRRTGRRPASRPLLPPPQARKKGFGDL